MGRARDLGLHLIGHLPAVGERLIAAMTETTVNYRAGHGRWSGTSHAVVGDHAPDVPDLHTAEGAATHIDALLGRPGHLLLVVGAEDRDLERFREALGTLGTVVSVATSADDPSTDDPSPDAVIDPAHGIARHYGVGDHGFVLVRPDGYLACVSRGLDDRPLVDHLRALAPRHEVI